MASVASQLIEEVTAHAQSDSLEDAREICADGTYFPKNLSTQKNVYVMMVFRLLSSLHVVCVVALLTFWSVRGECFLFPCLFSCKQ